MENHDLTATECKKAFAAGKVKWVQANPNELSILFLTDSGDKGFVVSGNKSAIKRYKTALDRDIAISIIKGL